MAAVSNVIAFGLLYMRPLQWCLKTKGVSPRGNLLCMIKVTRRCLRALDMWRRPWFLSQGLVLGAPCRRVMLATDASLTGWGMVMSGHPARGSLRAGPSGEERGPPHSSVPVSPQCPREISLPTLPVFQGAAVSSEPTPQSSARKRSGAGELATPVGVSTAASSAVSCSPNNTRGQSRETERGYRIQFGAPPPFNGVFPTVVSPEQGLVMEQEVGTPVEEGGHRGGLSSRQGVRVLQPVRGLVCDDRSKRRLLPRLHASSTQEVPEVCFQGRSIPISGSSVRPSTPPRTFTKSVDAALAPLRLRGIHILNCVNDWLILAQLEHMAVQHRDVVLAHMKELGLRLNAKKSVLSPLQRTTYLGAVWDLTTMQARLSPARIESILTAVTRVKEGRSLTVKQFQRLLGLMAAASNVIPFGLLYMRPPQWWLKTKGFSPRGNPLHMIKVTRRCLHALDMWRKPWFLALGPVLGAPCHRVTLVTDASLTGWGVVMDGHPAHGLWSGHHLSWHINYLEMLAMFRALKHFLPDLRDHHVLVGTDNTAVVYYINHQGAPYWPSRAWFADLISLLDGSPWGIPRQEGSPLASRRHHSPPSPGVVEVMGVASEGAHLVASGLSTEVVETILQSRAPSTRKLYALKWKLFTSWCGDHQQDPVNCPVGTVLEFLQDQFSAGLAHSTLKVYVAAIAAYHALLGGSSVGRNPLVTGFLH
ncbi:hypothetical protein M9458_051428, partial [Cirrhinus mrigala]